MKICKKCGTQVNDTTKFCPKCGAPIEAQQQQQQQQQQRPQNPNNNNYSERIQNLNNTNDYSSQYDRNDIETNKVLALFSYFGFLFLIPLLGAPNSKYARFHASQGLNLFIAEIAITIASVILSAVIGWIPIVGLVKEIAFYLIDILLFVLAVIGIVNAVGGKAKELPLIGGLRILK
jgi:uncharacterized membrane protein